MIYETQAINVILPLYEYTPGLYRGGSYICYCWNVILRSKAILGTIQSIYNSLVYLFLH
jgi:hypothetical protein